MENTHVGREFLKAYGWSRRGTSDQQKGVPMPAIQKALPENAQTLNLVDPAEFKVGNVAVLDVIKKRQSRRRFTNEPLTLEELSYLLWATQGLRAAHRDGRPSFRTVPSAGARHPFETYVAVHRVEGLEPGLYRYLPLDHKLCLIYQSDSLPDVVTEACIGQRFVAEAAAVFVWTVIPYRAEWRYAVASHKHIALMLARARIYILLLNPSEPALVHRELMTRMLWTGWLGLTERTSSSFTRHQLARCRRSSP